MYPGRVRVVSIGSVNAITGILAARCHGSCNVQHADGPAGSGVLVKKYELIMMPVPKELSPNRALVSQI